MTSSKKRVLVLAPNEFSHVHLRQVPNANRYDFVSVLEYDELLSNEPKSFDEFSEELEPHLAEGKPDGIIAFWDFPATCLAAHFSDKYDLPGPSLISNVKCEHKFWSRRLQREVIPDCVPAFERVDPFDDSAWEKLELSVPFWLKPIKSVSSMLGFRIESKEDFDRALEETRDKIHIYADSFGQALDRVEGLPQDIQQWGSRYCIAEAIIGGDQLTIEGFVLDGEVHFHGVVDSIRHTNKSTFSRYQYPSRLPRSVVDRVEQVSSRVLKHLGYDWGTFNIEYFYDAEQDQLWLLEINPRISQSHAALFQLAGGAPNFSELVSIAVGETPPQRAGGEYKWAAKLFYRTLLRDGIVTAVPSEDEIAAIEEAIPGTEIQLSVERGARLSDLPCQDSYTYELALLHIGAHSEGEILQKYQECVDRLVFSFDDIDDRAMSDEHARVSAEPELRTD